MLKNMLFLFKFYFFVFFFFGLHCDSFFLSQYTLIQNRKRCQTSFAKSLPLFPCLSVFGISVLWLSSDLLFCLFVLSPFFLSVFPIFFFRQKPDVFDPENCGTVDNLRNTQKESNQQKHRTCLFTDACQHFPFLKDR